MTPINTKMIIFILRCLSVKKKIISIFIFHQSKYRSGSFILQFHLSGGLNLSMVFR